MASPLESLASTAEATGRPLRPSKPPVINAPRGPEREMARGIKQILTSTKAIFEEVVLPRLGEIEAMANPRFDSDRMDVDRWPDMLRRLFERTRMITSSAIRGAPTRIATEAADTITSRNERDMQRQFRSALGVDVFMNNQRAADQAAAFIQDNVKLIQSVSDRYIDDLEQALFRNFRLGLTAEDAGPELAKRFNIASGRAVLIARDQTSKLNGELTRVRQQSLGVEEYIWRTSQDERVRSTHRSKEGRKFRWDDPPADTGHPGNDINCRCTAEPVLDL